MTRRLGRYGRRPTGLIRANRDLRISRGSHGYGQGGPPTSLGGGAIDVSSDTVRIKPGTSALVTVVPVKFPYMDPEAVSVRVKEFVRKGQKAGSPISIASISGRIGGTAIDFQPLRNSMMNNGKFSIVNWPVFSTVGLARELQFVARNNSKNVIEVTISVRGKPIR